MNAIQDNQKLESCQLLSEKKKIENILKIGYTNDALLCKVYYDNLKQFFFTIVLSLEQKITAKNCFSMGH